MDTDLKELSEKVALLSKEQALVSQLRLRFSFPKELLAKRRILYFTSTMTTQYKLGLALSFNSEHVPLHLKKDLA